MLTFVLNTAKNTIHVSNKYYCRGYIWIWKEMTFCPAMDCGDLSSAELREIADKMDSLEREQTDAV